MMRKLFITVSGVLAAWFIAATVYAGVFDYDTTAANNTTIAGIGVSNSMAPTSLDDVLRALAADTKKFQEDLGCKGVSSGTDTISLTSTSTLASYSDGDVLCFTAGGTNTTSATLNVDTVGAQDLKKYTQAGLVSLAAGDVTTGGKYLVVYESTNADWILINPSLGSFYSAGGTDVALADGGTGASLSDPNADRFFFWDDSAGATAFLTPGSSLSVTTTTVQALVPWCVMFSDVSTAITATAGKAEFSIPYAFTVTGVYAALGTAQTSGNIFTVDINESGTTIISTKLTIDNTEKTSGTAVAAAVISDSSIAAYAPISIDVDQIGDGTAKQGEVCLLGYAT